MEVAAGTRSSLANAMHHAPFYWFVLTATSRLTMWHPTHYSELGQQACSAKSPLPAALTAMRGLVVYVVIVLLQYAATPAILLLAILHVAQRHFGAGLSWIYASPILTFVLGTPQ